eukprot:TRINITY_DN4821_c0_g1_i2.p3 TRINITY_DN4821_c0_g1~~TRINITY_DN4821_c0_g1_i2.p3  ORF type:complete len:127 (+),score=7.42 TRINITY_DN4821_c0_g1_i2:369-749(+)
MYRPTIAPGTYVRLYASITTNNAIQAMTENVQSNSKPALRPKNVDGKENLSVGTAPANGKENCPYRTGRWSSNEVKRFDEALVQYGCENKEAITEHVRTRTLAQVQQRIRNHLLSSKTNRVRPMRI